MTNDIVQQFRITIVPLLVTIGTETFPETELSNEQYFEKLNHSNSLSTTSQPSVGAFLNACESLFSQGGEEIISLHLSSAISGTIRSA
ncbi:DegV family protein [Desulfosporosinus sp. FKB]|uniref:DegV family protein n=1 Tax=Desulfosporosinus sp. FKB TaxID=1969835 RepID=UPI001FA93EC1|nr:DegV family protein [Desulfosporosinus sp. FKB]